ncbi:MAG: restriction endonuclease subunit S, partial [Desulfobacterales bacterium]
PCFENGKAAFLNDLGSEYGFGSTEFHVLRSMEQKIIPKFLYYIIHSPLFMNTGEAFMTGAAGQKRVPASFVEEFLIGIPSIEEQVKIVDHIDQQHKIVDEVINTSSRHIELLKEYRTTLISDVVTGKIDVRDEVIP